MQCGEVWVRQRAAVRLRNMQMRYHFNAAAGHRATHLCEGIGLLVYRCSRNHDTMVCSERYAQPQPPSLKRSCGTDGKRWKWGNDGKGGRRKVFMAIGEDGAVLISCPDPRRGVAKAGLSCARLCKRI